MKLLFISLPILIASTAHATENPAIRDACKEKAIQAALQNSVFNKSEQLSYKTQSKLLLKKQKGDGAIQIYLITFRNKGSEEILSVSLSEDSKGNCSVDHAYSMEETD